MYFILLHFQNISKYILIVVKIEYWLFEASVIKFNFVNIYEAQNYMSRKWE